MNDLWRVDFALIPDDPLFGLTIDASQSITDEFYYNENIVDATTFPPHVSLHICAVPPGALPQIRDRLAGLCDRVTDGLPDLVPIGVEPASDGYVMLNLEATEKIMDLHEAVLDIAAEAREGLGGNKYGSPYIRDLFTPHVSLAKVEHREQTQAVAIGRDTLGELSTARTRSLDLCDIGEKSDRWDVLLSVAA